MKNYHATFKAIFDTILKKFENDNFDSEGTIFRHASYVERNMINLFIHMLQTVQLKTIFFEHYLIVCE